jgi:CheY-like chemotaxis protein
MADDTAPHALVVDDDALIRMDAADIIEQAGFRPLEAYDVDSAVNCSRDVCGRYPAPVHRCANARKSRWVCACPRMR